jgi:hypothetical protein
MSNCNCDVYLLHFSVPVGNSERQQVQHYCGSTTVGAGNRLERHINGNGSPLVRFALECGASVELARVWDNVNCDFEFYLKHKRKNLRKLCPLCDTRADKRLTLDKARLINGRFVHKQGHKGKV